MEYEFLPINGMHFIFWCFFRSVKDEETASHTKVRLDMADSEDYGYDEDQRENQRLSGAVITIL